MITRANDQIRTSEIFEKLEWEPLQNILRKREFITTLKVFAQNDTHIFFRLVYNKS